MRTGIWILIMGVLFVSGGATCARREAPVPFPPPPTVFTNLPSAAELAAIVNRTSSIQQLSSNSASVEVLSMPKIPRLSATLALQRSHRFRMRASLPIVLGSGMDVGSNEDLFWFEVPEGMRKTLYYARHDQYRQQLNRAVIPVDPTWIMDALGLVQLDASQIVAGPVKRSDGKLEVRTALPMPGGIYQKVCFIESSAGYVTDQFLYGPDGGLIAKSSASDHRYYDEHQCALPHLVQLELNPKMGPPMSLKIEIGSYTVNQLLSGDPNLFSMPQDAASAVDLTTLSANIQPAIQTMYYATTRDTSTTLRGTF